MKKKVNLVCVLYAPALAAGMAVSSDNDGRASAYSTQEL